ncbi:MAG: phage tail tape measure protein, partial [Deltaproteobacteria bacterium]|nr:phage tail tape measure protein [Deltaproteobacteria bacterium]
LATIYASFHTLIGAVVTTAKFEQAIKKLGVVSGATTEELGELEEAALGLGETTIFSASQVAEGLNEMALGGLSAAEQMAGIEDVLNLAAIGMINLAEASNISVVAMKSWGLEAEQIGDITDIIAKGSTNSATTITQLGQALSKVGTVAKAYNVSLEETVAALGVLADAGRKGAEAGTQLKIVMSRLAGNKEAEKYLKGLGVTIYDATGKILPFAQQLANVREKLMLLPPPIRAIKMSEIFGEEGKASAIALMENLDKLETKLQDLKKAMADDFASTAAKEMMDTLTGSYKELLSALEGLAIEIGQTLIPILRELMESAAEAIRELDDEQVREFAEGIGALIEVVGTAISVFASLSGAILSTIGANKTLLKMMIPLVAVFAAFASKGTALVSVMALLSPKIKAVTAAMVALRTAMLAHPIMAIITVAMVALAGYIQRMEEAVAADREWVDQAAESVDRWLKITDTLEQAWDKERENYVLSAKQKKDLIALMGEEYNALDENIKKLEEKEDLDESQLELLGQLKEEKKLIPDIVMKLVDALDKEKIALGDTKKAWEEYGYVSNKAAEDATKFYKMFDKRVNKAKTSLAKIIKEERKLLLERSKLVKEGYEITKKYADLRIDLEDEYNKKAYDLSNSGLNDFEVYQKDKTRIAELGQKARQALNEGDYDRAKGYYEEMKSLASSFGGEEIIVNEKVLASREETQAEALRIYEITKAGEAAILVEQERAELEAHKMKLDMLDIELEAMKVNIKLQQDGLKALAALYKGTFDKIGEMSDPKVIEDFTKKIEDLQSKIKDQSATITFKLDADKFKQEKANLEKDVNSIKDPTITPKLDKSDVDNGVQDIENDYVETSVTATFDEEGNLQKYEILATAPKEKMITLGVTQDQYDAAMVGVKEDVPKVVTLTTKKDGSYDVDIQEASKYVEKEVKLKINKDEYTLTAKQIEARNLKMKLLLEKDPVKWNLLDIVKEVEDTEAEMEVGANTEPAKTESTSAVNEINKMEAQVKVGANTSQVRTDINAIISWINSQSATLDVYENYHPAHAGGGLVQKLASGGSFSGSGKVPGYDPTDSDKVNASLTGGEFVIKREAVDSYGLSLLHAINQMRYQKPQGYAEGGSVGNSIVTTSALQPVTINIGTETFEASMTPEQVVEAFNIGITRQGGL